MGSGPAPETCARQNAPVQDSTVAFVHGPGWPVASPEAIGRLLAALEARPDAAVGVIVGSLTDTLKSVDASGLVTATLDRSEYRALLSPIAVRPALLPDDAARARQPGSVLPGAAQVLAAAERAGRPVIEVEA